MQNISVWLKKSILDRLMDFDPQKSHEPAIPERTAVDQIKFSLVRDLENLLNTRKNYFLPLLEFREISRSFFVYGLKDFSGENPNNSGVKNELCAELRELIEKFEPRLKQVNVQFDQFDAKDRNLRFRITALFVVEPIRENMTFDTFFNLTNHNYVIKT